MRLRTVGISYGVILSVIHDTSDHSNALRGIEIGGIKLGDCLNKVYQNIVAYWNFEDKENVRYLCGVMSHTVPTL